jgi:hypothetical protein
MDRNVLVSAVLITSLFVIVVILSKTMNQKKSINQNNRFSVRLSNLMQKCGQQAAIASQSKNITIQLVQAVRVKSYMECMKFLFEHDPRVNKFVNSMDSKINSLTNQCLQKIFTINPKLRIKKADQFVSNAGWSA